MWQKLPYICNIFFYYNNLSITFLNYCTIEKSPVVLCAVCLPKFCNFLSCLRSCWASVFYFVSGGTEHRRRPTHGSTYLLESDSGFHYKSYLPEGADFFREGVPGCCIDWILSPGWEVLLAPFKPTMIQEPTRPILEELKNWSSGRSCHTANTDHVAWISRATTRHVWGTNLKGKYYLHISRKCQGWLAMGHLTQICQANRARHTTFNLTQAYKRGRRIGEEGDPSPRESRYPPTE